MPWITSRFQHPKNVRKKHNKVPVWLSTRLRSRCQSYDERQRMKLRTATPARKQIIDSSVFTPISLTVSNGPDCVYDGRQRHVNKWSIYKVNTVRAIGVNTRWLTCRVSISRYDVCAYHIPCDIHMCTMCHLFVLNAMRFIYAQSPYQHSGFQRVWLKHVLTYKGWNAHVHRGFRVKFDSSNVSRRHVSRRIEGNIIYGLNDLGPVCMPFRVLRDHESRDYDYKWNRIPIIHFHTWSEPAWCSRRPARRRSGRPDRARASFCL